MEAELQVLLTSMWDVRVGVPLGVVLGLNPVENFLLGVAAASGVLLPFLFGFEYIMKALQLVAPRFASWLVRYNERHKRSIERYGYLGLVLFVGIPLPGTGSWAGALVAGLLRLDVWRSFAALVVGIAISAGLSLYFATAVVEESQRWLRLLSRF